MGTLSEQIAAYVTGLHYEDLPPNVVERVCLHALNIIGVCLLSARMEFADVLQTDIMIDGGVPESTLIGGGGQKLPAPLASLYNSSLAHGNEFDDTYAPGRWHASAPTIPPAFAVAESLRVDGKTLVTSLAGALEMGCRLARAAPTLMQNGLRVSAHRDRPFRSIVITCFGPS